MLVGNVNVHVIGDLVCASKPLAAASKLKTGAAQRPVGRGPCSRPPSSSNPTVPIGAVSLPGTANSAGSPTHPLSLPTAFVRLDLQWGQASKFNILLWPKVRCSADQGGAPKPAVPVLDFWTPPVCPVLSCPLSCLCRRRLCVSGRSFSLPRDPHPILAVDASKFRSFTGPCLVTVVPLPEGRPCRRDLFSEPACYSVPSKPPTPNPQPNTRLRPAAPDPDPRARPSPAAFPPRSLPAIPTDSVPNTINWRRAARPWTRRP